jgi:hypothetical protein
LTRKRGARRHQLTLAGGQRHFFSRWLYSLQAKQPGAL